MNIRAYHNDDFDRLFEANQTSVPGVGHETERSLAKWIGLSTCLVAVNAADQALGFITLMALDQPDYNSANMRWFEAYRDRTGKSIVYVDRIAVHTKARGQGLGAELYRAAFERFQACDEIGCEVNTLPPNPGSHRFHRRLGFEPVGETIYRPGEKAVRFYARPLQAAPGF
ncbi:MAG: GNAT family N-acetyltransferase [Pseudomonadota bacterium]